MFRSSKYQQRNGWATYIPVNITPSALPRAQIISFNSEFQSLQQQILTAVTDFMAGTATATATMATLTHLEEILVIKCAAVANTPNCC